MNLKELSELFIQKSKEKAEIDRLFDSKRYDCEKYLKNIFKEECKNKLPKHEISFWEWVDFQKGKFQIYIRSVNNASFFEDGWAKQDAEDDYGFGIPTGNSLNFEDFQSFVSDFKIKYPDVCVELSYMKKRAACDFEESEINSYSMIKLFYKDKQVSLVSEGEVWYTGWDISDRYIICEIDGVRHAYYQNSGHGGTLDIHVVDGTAQYLNFEKWRTEKH